jgi:hypothetical protein
MRLAGGAIAYTQAGAGTPLLVSGFDAELVVGALHGLRDSGTISSEKRSSVRLAR